LASAPSASRTPEAAPSAAAGTSPAADVTVITTRDDFILELGPVIGGRAALHPVSSVGAALEGMAAIKGTQLLAIDARCVGNMPAALETLNTKAPNTVVLVFANSVVEERFGEALRGSRAFAVLSFPIDAGATQAAFDGAVAVAEANRATASAAAAAPKPKTASLVAAPPPPPPKPAAVVRVATSAPAPLPTTLASVSSLAPSAPEPSPDSPTLLSPNGAIANLFAGNKKRTLLVAAAVGALALGGVLWFLINAVRGTGGESAADLAPIPAPTAETTLIKGKVDELLEKARLAIRERRFAEPPGDNALVYYRSAAAADPSSAEARDGLQRVAGVFAGRFGEAMSAKGYDEAAQNLANFRAAAPAGDPRALAMAQQFYAAVVGKALADGALERASAFVRQAEESGLINSEQLAKWRTEISRRQKDTKSGRLATLVEERIRSGRLTEANDSARSYLQALQTVAPNSADAQRATQELIAAYVHNAREAVRTKNSAEAERWLKEARALGMSSTDAAALEREIAEVRPKAASEPSAARAVSAPPLAPRAPPLDPATLASSLKPIKRPPPAYPDGALSKHQSGSVLLSFTVDTKGETRDIKVINSTPEGTFDQAAMSAVKNWRYEPMLVNGTAVEVPVKAQVRFELPK